MNLEEHPFILAVDEERRAEVVKEIELLELEDKSILFDEGSASDALFLILSGTVTFTKKMPDGSRKSFSESGKGSFFGEVGVFTGEERALGAMALGSCRVARVPKSTVNKILEDAEPLRQILVSVISHLKRTTDHYMDEVVHTEKLTLVGTMVSSLLHDFKNPFSIISLGANIIGQRYKDDAKTTKICANIESQIRRMVNMANDLGAFARGDSQINVTQIDVDDLFADFHELNRPFFKDEGFLLIMRGNGVKLRGDAGKLLRVFQNLISNSIEAFISADINGRVEVIAKEDETNVTFTISDNGPGIPEGIRETIFDPFVTRGKIDGTGLGTAIVKSIIDAHHGQISFETSAEGTTFTIRLPK